MNQAVSNSEPQQESSSVFSSSVSSSSAEQKAMKRRIASIDILRGLVMLFMLVDHVRERFFYHQNVGDPMSLDETSTSLFFTRISAHFCAPVFVFLTGLGAWLYAHPANGEPRSARDFLLKRGLFIILVEATLINFSWFGNYEALYLQVMWAIGTSMIVLAFVSGLNIFVVGALGAAIVFGHNALEFIQFSPDEMGYTLWTILHDRGYILTTETFKIKASYPVLPWIGVILLGYVCGPLFARSVEAGKRQKMLFLLGATSLLLLLLLRGFNLYGETIPWQVHDSVMTTVQDFINYTKYPPSLNFLLMTLGVACLVLGVLEFQDNRITKIIEGFGSAPMFFYVLHLYVLLISYRVLVGLFGTNQVSPSGTAFWGVDYVWQMWAISALLAITLYFPTKRFSDFKKRTTLWWVKYF